MSRVRQILVALVATVICAAPLAAQTGTIRGRVVDVATRAPLVAVAVAVTDRTMQSDADGRFMFAATPAGRYVLRLTRVGYRPALDTVVVAAGQTTEVEIAMEPVAVELAAVVVTSYGDQQAARNVTGVLKEVTAEEFNPGRVVTAEQLIQAKVPGVRVIDNGGEPGGRLSMRIRGGTSITSSNEPLFVVDGQPLAVGSDAPTTGRNPLNFLNPNDIESITVLKDASATAIYGSRGANGVVLIRTRGGRSTVGEMGSRLTYTGSVTGSFAEPGPPMLTAQQFRTAVAQYNPDASALLGNYNTDWRGAILRTGIAQEHTLAFAGATNNFDYRLSLNYMKEQGIIKRSGTERATVGVSFNHLFFDDRVRLSANIRGSRLDDQYDAGQLGAATFFQPTQPILDPESPYGGYFEWYDYSLAANNPVATMELTTNKGTIYRSVGNIEGEVEIPWVKGLRGTVRFGYDAAKTSEEYFQPSYMKDQSEAGLPGYLRRRNFTGTNMLFDAFANYERSLDNINTDINLTAGYSYEAMRNEFPEFEASGLSFDLLGTAGVPAARQTVTRMWLDESRLISFFGRAHFTVADRYLLTLAVRRDGSSKFGPENQWGTFPSVAVGWRISDEPFMQSVPAISDLKLRASWGKNGNQAIGNYLQYPTYDIGEATVQYKFGDEFVTTIRPGAADRGIKWEELTSWDVGLDFGFSNQRYTGSIDYYFKRTNDLIFRVPVPAGTFTSNYITTNIGTIKNSGLELGLSAVIAEGRDGGFSWTADFNAATNTNEIEQINPYAIGLAEGGSVILTGAIGGAVGNFIQLLQPGQANNTFYVYEHIRDADGKPIWEDTDGNGTIDENDIYVDQNGDGIVNLDDRRPYKTPDPKWTFGHTSRMAWKNFDASFTMRANVGNYVYNNVASNYGHYRALTYAQIPNNLHASVLETGFEREQYFSDYYIENASLLRLDNVTVGYTFTLGSGQQMRVFGVAQNLFTLTGYSGVDPLAGVNGIDNDLYPRSRKFTAGASVQF